MTVVVTAAVIERDGRFLITRRLEGTHLEGLWEFPGGKCTDGESLENCLRRELTEELGADAIVGKLIYETSFAYPGRTMKLHFFSGTLIGEPRPMIGQEMQWVHRDELKLLQFPPADDELIRLLQTVC
ncbi:MAG TPA: (deoxy)nucleoside triphosphate pyrophosphohydrolase [Vicinamibacterales bacterium]|nr:(deoxy)nucleoside triphosphate pyrophosphohydrolase [Vicinamibacterales bacterium]